MSDESYEYDDDADEDMEDNFEYTDEEEEADDAQVALENAYYNAKGLRETSLQEAADALEQVIQKEVQENHQQYGPWSFKSMKQLVKLYLKLNHAPQVMFHYQLLLECAVSDNVSANAVEKGIHAMLERISQSSMPLAEMCQIYKATLHVSSPMTGTFPNERLWFKSNIKYG
jgi:COP9 signalosome complex subunit 2